MAWVMLPLDATARSSVIEGTTTTDSSSWLSRIASQTPAIRACSSSKRRYRSSSVSADSTSGPAAGARPEVAGHDTVRALSTPLTLKAWMLPAEAAQLAVAGVLAHDDRPGGGEDPLGDEDLPGFGVAHSRAARLVTLPIAA